MCAAGRLRTKNASPHLLRHNHFAWYALYVEEREKRDRIFTEKNALYLHIAYLIVWQGQYSISFRKMQDFFAHAAETRKTKKPASACTSKHSRALGQKKIPPSRVHPKRKPCIARRYPRLCFALPTSAAVEPRGRPAYLQSDIGFHLKVVGSDMVVYHKLSRKVCYQYMRVRAIYALSFRYCRRPRPRRNPRC